MSELESGIQGKKYAQAKDCLEQDTGLLDGECGEYMQHDGKPEEGTECHHANQKGTDIGVIPTAVGIDRSRSDLVSQEAF